MRCLIFYVTVITAVYSISCTESDSAATRYKKGLNSGDSLGASPGDGGGADLVARGTSLYNQSCASCHENAVPGANPLLESGTYVQADIESGQSLTSLHQGVNPWPTGNDAAALAAAFSNL